MFTHLHTHTEYSLLDGAGRIGDLIDAAKAHGMQSIAITDHGFMYGVIDFYAAARKAGLKPIIGCEVYVASGSRFEKTSLTKEYAHLILLAKDEAGYKNLMQLVSLGSLEGFYYKPRIDYDLLEQHTEGLICLSACLAGDIPRLLLQNNYNGAKALTERLRGMFGEDFYLEIQDHGIDEQRQINPLLIKLSNETGIKLVATNDVHYVRREDAYAQEVLMCVQTASTLDDPDRMVFTGEEFYLKSEDEMRELFSNIPETIDVTQEIADKCDLELVFGESHLPHFDVPDGYTHEGYLQHVAEEGLKARYPELTPEIEERFTYELRTIENMGFTDYFLIVWDFVNYAKQQDIMVGPGRGSAAGSIVAYALGITGIDPLKYNLLFERFLNPERISMPDIDIDFCYERRQEVIDYVTRKYGADRVAQIITFGTLGARLVIRDVARAMSLPVSEGDRIAKMIPFELKMTIDRALTQNPKLKEEYEKNPQIRNLLDVSKRLEGMPRHASTHAAGVVISRDPITEYVPLQKNPKDESVMTQYPMKKLEDLGLLKMDFLGLRTLTVIRDAVIMAKQNHGVEIDIDNIPLDDQDVYAMVAAGQTEGVFQVESAGMTRLMQDLQPSSLDDLMVGIALFRPGPMEFIPEYIRCKKNPGKVHYAHPLLEPILSDTYGCMVYQEQIMRIVRDVAGYSMARSDLVRRAMSKKQQSVLEKERKLFIYGGEEDGAAIEGAVSRGMDERTATALFDQMMAFANYAFNKSHACAYAVVAYQTAWLKYYYPVEFMTALLNSFIHQNQGLARYIQNLKKSGLDLLPPDINKSGMRFTTESGSIRFGLSALAYVGDAVGEVITRRGQGYQGFEDFVEKNADVLNKKRLESLILSGCFDCFGVYRSQLMAVYEHVLQEATQAGKRQASGQISLFDTAQDEFDALRMELPDIPEMGRREKLAREKEMTGLYLSGHPLDSVRDELMARPVTVADIMRGEGDEMTMYEYDGKKVELLGILTSVRGRLTRQKKMMANIVLEDLYAQIPGLVFPNVLSESERILKPDNIVYLAGRVSVGTNGIELLVESVRPHEPEAGEFAGKTLYLKLASGAGADMDGLADIARRHPGRGGAIVFVEETGQKFKLGGKSSVRYSGALLDELKGYLGAENVVMQ